MKKIASVLNSQFMYINVFTLKLFMKQIVLSFLFIDKENKSEKGLELARKWQHQNLNTLQINYLTM